MATLSKRLELIASLVPQGKSVCDVGTDHGYLPAALYLSNKYPKISATDIREKPLASARKNLEKLGIDKVNLVLCDGLEALCEADAQTVIIAGMGGDVISGIISRCPYKEKPFFILQPMTASTVLREYLAQNGFCVCSESALREKGKIYSIMTAKYDGNSRKLSQGEKRIGILKPENADNTAYIKKQLDIAKKCVLDLKNVPEKQELFRENEEAVKEITKILEG